MNKLIECPECGETLHSDCWTVGRKLQQRCDCGWSGELRIPGIIPIEDTKTISVNQFSGFNYEIFDKYGHITTYSRSYDSKIEARKEMEDDLAKHNKHPDMAPCTAILWPDKVMVTGEVVN